MYGLVPACLCRPSHFGGCSGRSESDRGARAHLREPHGANAMTTRIARRGDSGGDAEENGFARYWKLHLRDNPEGPLAVDARRSLSRSKQDRGADLRNLLSALGRSPDERMTVCTKVDGLFKPRFITVAGAPDLAAEYPTGVDVWYGTGVLHSRVTGGRGLEKDIVGVREIFADVDVKPGAMPDLDAAEAVIDALSELLGARPVAVVNSGHGLQPHWALEAGPGTDWTDETSPEYEEAYITARRWGRLCAHVVAEVVPGAKLDTVSNLDRILRVPGTENVKDDPVPVTMELTGGSPVPMAQLRELLDGYGEVGVKAQREDRLPHGEKVSDPADWVWAEKACSYAQRMIDGWATDTPLAGRHNWLTSQFVRLAAAHRYGCLREGDHAAGDRALTTRFRALLDTPPARAESYGEIAGCEAWAAERVATFDDVALAAELGGQRRHAHVLAHTEEAFWQARPELAHIRLFARARQASPWATLAVVLTRVIAATEPNIVLPPLIGQVASLNMFVALVGKSGDGKDAAIGAARAAVDLSIDVPELLPGSGEGLVHIFLHRVREERQPSRVEQRTTRILLIAGEIDTLAALFNRQASTLMPELRKAYMGQELGFHYVDESKRLPMAAQTYRLCLIAGVQPGKARTLLDDAAGGTPQRFFWAEATDPTAPDWNDLPNEPRPWLWKPPPELDDTSRQIVVPVCPTACAAIRGARSARLRGENNDTLDGHLLLCREKLAIALGLLAGRIGIEEEDWALAGVMIERSSAVRDDVVAQLAAEQRRANVGRAAAEAEREIVVEERTTRDRVARVSKRIVEHLRERAGWVPHREVRSKMAQHDRQWFEEAIQALLRTGQIEVQETRRSAAGHGSAGLRYRSTP